MALILVTNDDGVHSAGIIALFKTMKKLGEAFIIAPDRERSAAGHSLTLHRPLRVEEIRDNVYSINGTPTDCVTMGINKVLRAKPDLIVSGINKGGNLGDDITYSGTVSAAVEGTIFGIPSVAFSIVGGPHYHYETCSFFAEQIASYVLDKALPYDTLLNVNVPNLKKEDVKGIRFTRQGRRIYENSIQETYDPWGNMHYWIGGGRPFWEHGEDTDMETVHAGFVSITPLHLDMTNYEALNFLRQKWAFSDGGKHESDPLPASGGKDIIED